MPRCSAAGNREGGAIMNLRLHCRRANGMTVVYCAGRITFGKEATVLANCIADLLAKRQRILLNLGGVEAVDAAGLGALAQLSRVARATGGQIELCDVPEGIARLLEMTRLSQVLKIHVKEAEALAVPGRGFPESSSAVPATA